MNDNIIKKYSILNRLAEPNGTVIFGGAEDREIPLGELKQAFSLSSQLYNRSIDNLSAENATELYSVCVSELNPETVILHIGDADLADFEKDTAGFEQKYRSLIMQIRADDKKRRIAVISLKNPDNTAEISRLNKHLKYIAESEQCEYFDISSKRLWNPVQAKDTSAFIHSVGFVRPLKSKQPLSDLVRILFCCA